MKTRRQWLQLGLAAGGAAILGRPAWAQEKYPNRPIRMIAPHPPGGGVDILARAMAEGMAGVLGQPVIVENRPGANGTIGAAAGAAAAPDGYTIMMNGPGEIAIAPHLYKQMVYDPFKDLAPITLCSKAPNVLVVGANSPLKSVVEIIALAKSKPGELTFGSSGVGNIQHLEGELFNKYAGVKTVHVPYKGAAPQIADIVGGQITMGYMSVAAAMPLIKGGRLRPIAVTSKVRVPALPDVPTLAETPVLSAYELDNWFGLFAPAAIPKPILATLNGAAVKVLATPEMQARIIDGGAIPAPGTPEAFAAFIAAQSQIYAQIIKEVGITADS